MSTKKILLVALVAFAIYFLVRSPVESATAVNSVSDWVGQTASDLAASLTTFLQTLF